MKLAKEIEKKVKKAFEILKDYKMEVEIPKVTIAGKTVTYSMMLKANDNYVGTHADIIKVEYASDNEIAYEVAKKVIEKWGTFLYLQYMKECDNLDSNKSMYMMDVCKILGLSATYISSVEPNKMTLTIYVDTSDGYNIMIDTTIPPYTHLEEKCWEGLNGLAVHNMIHSLVKAVKKAVV